MAATKPDIAALVDQMPEVDKPGTASKFTGPDPAVAEKTFAEICGGGRASMLELIALVREAADEDFQNYKAGYLLHGLAIHLGRAGAEKDRRLLAETLAAQLDNPKVSKPTKKCFIRELQVVGGPEVVAALGKQLQDEELCQDAVLALQAIGGPAAGALATGLRTAKGRNRAAIIQALGALKDTAASSAMQKAIGDEEPDVRLAAAWALANLGDAKAVGAMLRTADAAQGWERIQLTKACLLMAEKLSAAGQRTDAGRIYQYLRDTRKDDSEKYVREVAEKALAGAK